MSVKISGSFKPLKFNFKPVKIEYTVTFGVPSGSIGSYNMSTDYSADLSATSTAADVTSYSISAGALPSGILLNTNSGVIAGTLPSVQNDTSYNFTLQANDARGNSNTASYTLTVLTTLQTVVWITATPLTDASAGGGYFTKLEAEVKRGS